MATKTASTRVEKPDFAEVKAALDKTLGKPKKVRGISSYKEPTETKETKEWIARVHAAGGSASLAAAYPTRVLAVVEGPPSGLMDLVTWVSWQSKSARKALDMLDRDAGLRISNINYTDFVIKLDRVPKDPESHAKRLAKIVHFGDADEIATSLRKKRWKTG
jgi:hypothetical protein